MKQKTKSSRKERLAKTALRRRVLRWYDRFNGQQWSDCFRLVDPCLTSCGKVSQEPYTRSLREFLARYGEIRPWHVRFSLHLTGSRPASDPRPFAYAYTVWQDERHEFHMFRERWVFDSGRWYTRVAGLIVNDSTLPKAG